MNHASASDMSEALAQEKAGVFKAYPFWGHRGTGVGPWVLSQWWPCSFKVGRYSFSSAEQAMMAGKAVLFKDTQTLELILSTSSPKEVKALGRKVRGFDEQLWKRHATEIVLINTLAKFRQNPLLGEFLTSTTGTLVEASPYDRIWGVGMSPTDPRVQTPSAWLGENLLGFTLTAARAQL